MFLSHYFCLKAKNQKSGSRVPQIIVLGSLLQKSSTIEQSYGKKNSLREPNWGKNGVKQTLNGIFRFFAALSRNIQGWLCQPIKSVRNFSELILEQFFVIDFLSISFFYLFYHTKHASIKYHKFVRSLYMFLILNIF